MSLANGCADTIHTRNTEHHGTVTVTVTATATATANHSFLFRSQYQGGVFFKEGAAHETLQLEPGPISHQDQLLGRS